MAHITIANDPDNVLASLSTGEPLTMRDNQLVPINSQKRKKILDSVNHIQLQLGRLAKACDQLRADVMNLTVE